MPDPHYYTGSDDRDLSAVPLCDQCRVELLPAEVEDERCRRCTQDALDAGDDGDGWRGDEAAAYEREQRADWQALK